MINLIPPAARRSVSREYWLRAISVWLLLWGTGCVIVVVLLFPTYVLIRMQVHLIDADVSASSDKVVTFDVSSAELTLANTRAQVLHSVSSSTPFSTYIDMIETLGGNEVTIGQMIFSQLQTGGTIKLSGTAKTRQSLAEFRDSLEAETAFKIVNLPIANLIKERDLLFSMDIILATSTPTS